MAIIPIPRGRSQCTFPFSLLGGVVGRLAMLSPKYGRPVSGVGDDVVGCSGLGSWLPVRRGIGVTGAAAVRCAGTTLALRILELWERVEPEYASSSSSSMISSSVARV